MSNDKAQQEALERKRQNEARISELETDIVNLKHELDKQLPKEIEDLRSALRIAEKKKDQLRGEIKEKEQKIRELRD